MIPGAEKREIVSTVKSMIDNFHLIDGIDQREEYFKGVLDYLLTKPLFISSYSRFKNTVLRTIEANKIRRGGNSPFIDYDYYHSVISGL